MCLLFYQKWQVRGSEITFELLVAQQHTPIMLAKDGSL